MFISSIQDMFHIILTIEFLFFYSRTISGNLNTILFKVKLRLHGQLCGSLDTMSQQEE